MNNHICSYLLHHHVTCYTQMLHDQKMLRGRFRVIFGLVCLLLAGYMTLTQIVRYLKNEDSSTITQIQFNQTPLDDKYPTFSICLRGSDIYWLRENSLFENFGVTSSQFVYTLQGRGWRYEYNERGRPYHNKSVDIGTFPHNETMQYFLKPSDIIVKTEFLAQQEVHTTHYEKDDKGNNGDTPNPFNIGYQTPNEICFTRSSTDHVDLIRQHDLLSLDRKILLPGNNLNVEIRIIFHYPGGLIRNFDNPSFRSTFEAYQKDKILELKVSRVVKSKRRSDSNVPCNPNIDNDDETFQNEVIRRIGCVPVYWSYLLQVLETPKLCNSAEELKNSTELINNIKDVLSTYDPPCLDMTTLVMFTRDSHQRTGRFFIKVLYTEKFYQEIKNIKAFSFETFWSTAGGYLGFFLGYSLLQIPDLLTQLPPFLRRLRLPSKMGRLSTV